MTPEAKVAVWMASLKAQHVLLRERKWADVWLVGLVVALTVACAESPVAPFVVAPPAQTTSQPPASVLPSRIIYIVVYGVVTPGEVAQPIKARVIADGYARYTDAHGAVTISVTDATVIGTLRIEAWGYEPVVLHPSSPLEGFFMVMARVP